MIPSTISLFMHHFFTVFNVAQIVDLPGEEPEIEIPEKALSDQIFRAVISCGN
jgi:hypothetical protein